MLLSPRSSQDKSVTQPTDATHSVRQLSFELAPSVLSVKQRLPQSPQKLVDMIMNCLANSLPNLQPRPENTASGVPRRSMSALVIGPVPLNVVTFIALDRGVNQNLMNVGLHSITKIPPPWWLKPLNILLASVEATEHPEGLVIWLPDNTYRTLLAQTCITHSGNLRRNYWYWRLPQFDSDSGRRCTPSTSQCAKYISFCP
jgi:hypothetical protein